MNDKRTGLLKFNQKSGRFRIIYENNQFDYDELSSGMIFFVKILGVWKKSRIEYNSQKEIYYGVDLEIQLKDGLETSLFSPES